MQIAPSKYVDFVAGKYLEFVPYRRSVETVEFEADDPAFIGAMRITTTIAETPA